MRAVQAKEFGGPEVLVPVDLPDPLPGPGEVLIDVAYADTLFVETQVRAGWGREYFDVTPPYVPGGGVSGTVTETGPGVPQEWLGRRVVAHVHGSYASRAVAPVSGLAAVPEGLELRTAAALVHDGVTAAALLELTGAADGERVLVLGASGGMGTVLVQWARARGARVVGAARGARKLALVRELGAPATVDVSDSGWVDAAREALGGAADLVLDGVGGELGTSAFALTADGGRFSAHGAPAGGFAGIDGEAARRRGIRLFGIGDVQFGPDEHARLASYALAQAAAGRVRPVVGEVVELERASEAHAAIEDRRLVGKVVLRC
ncbi:zinc-binding dehydrogenase [Streptomyces sp. NPDC101152]|uniref:zinc-binding dehydrogenase n=1 Tax=Streptomyces sp. NPDC101152 TaxID=3366116 RepID=UPI0038272A44